MVFLIIKFSYTGAYDDFWSIISLYFIMDKLIIYKIVSSMYVSSNNSWAIILVTFFILTLAYILFFM